jgi:MFS family permease
MSATGTALGPTLGGWLIGMEGWPAIFWIGVPLGLLTALLGGAAWPQPRGGARAAVRFDIVGTLLLALAIGAFALAATLGRGQFGVANALLLGVAMLAGWGFVVVEERVAAPLLQPALLRRRPFGASFLTSALVATVVMATLVVGPFYLSGALSLDAPRVGMLMALGPLVAALVGLPAGHLADRYGALVIVRAGICTMVLGAFGFSMLPLSLGHWAYALPLVLITAGYGLFQSANNALVMAAASTSERGVVSGVLNLSRYVGLIGGASVMGAVFAFGSGTAPTAASLSAGLHLTYAVCAALLLAALGVAWVQGEGPATTGAQL